MELDREGLLSACKEVARATLWQTPEPFELRDIVDTDQIAATVQAYFDEAVRQADSVAEQGGDPNLVMRAVLYLAHEHAIPPMKDDVTWFEDHLDVLLRLVFPITEPAENAARFMKDVEAAAKAYRKKAGP